MPLMPAGHWSFQAANACLGFSYLASSVLHLRAALCAASFFFVLFNWVVLDWSLDGIIWNSIFMCINGYKMLTIIYERRPITFKTPVLEDLYVRVFKPLDLSRNDFQKLSEVAALRTLKAGSTYIEQGNEFHDLTLIHTGSMFVLKEDSHTEQETIINEVRPYEFVESPQYAVLTQQQTSASSLTQDIGAAAAADAADLKCVPDLEVDDCEMVNLGEAAFSEAQRSVMAVTCRTQGKCVFLSWPITKLNDFLAENPQIAPKLNAIIGADVAQRLLRADAVSSAHRQNRAKATNLVTLRVSRHSEDPVLKELEIQRDAMLAQWLLAETGSLYLCDSKRTTFSLKDATEIVNNGRWKYISRQGTCYLREGEIVDELAVLVQGEMSVTREALYDGLGQMATTAVQANQFMGSVEFDGAHVPASILTPDTETKTVRTSLVSSYAAHASYVSTGPCVLFVWNAGHLRELLRRRPLSKAALLPLLNRDIATKFTQVTTSVSTPVKPQHRPVHLLNHGRGDDSPTSVRIIVESPV